MLVRNINSSRNLSIRYFCFTVCTQAIIFNSSPNLVEPSFIPVSQRIKLKSDDLYTQEQALKTATRLESSERENIELNLMKVRINN